jgi:sec-independent protein translocase protein TatB
MELDELKKMKDSVEGAARDVQQSIQTGATDFEKQWADATDMALPLSEPPSSDPYTVFPEYKHPKKHWRVKTGAMPQWYKARAGVRTKALSGAARVARYRPKKLG